MKVTRWIIAIVICLILSTSLHFLLGLPNWLSIPIVVLLLIPPASYYTNMVLIPAYTFISIGVHLYTVVFAFTHAWWKAALTLVLPGISEVYWFIDEASQKDFKTSAYCTILMIYVLGLIVRFISPILATSLAKNDSPKRAEPAESSETENHDNG